jgi:hypothetical protein
MADKVLPGYPVPISGRQEWVVQHAGPTSYQAGGETFDIAHLNGGGVIDFLEASGLSFNASATGTYRVSVIYPIGQGASGATGSTTVVLQWFNVSTGVEASGNLSAEFIRLRLIGG